MPRSGHWRSARQGSPEFVFHRRFEAAVSHVTSGTLTVRRPSDFMDSWIVEASDFAAWAQAAGITLPEQLCGAFVAPATPVGSTGGRWPWGDHETELLRLLAAAAQKFWSNYDPADPSTAENSATVVEWLRAQRLSDGGQVGLRVAEIIAQILRADGLPTGPRKK